MATLTSGQERTRARVEGLIRLMAPVLDGILTVGEMISRRVEPTDHEYYPARSGRGEVRSPIGGDTESESRGA